MDIKTIISQHGISQVELAKRMNPDLAADPSQMNDEQRQELQKRQKSANSYVSQLISGKSDPSMKKLDLLAQLIGCQRWEFFIDEIRAAGYDVVKAQEEEKTDETINDNQGQQSGGEASAEDATTTEQEGAAADAPSDAPGQQAEQVRAVRFTYECPKCGERISVTIE